MFHDLMIMACLERFKAMSVNIMLTNFVLFETHERYSSFIPISHVLCVFKNRLLHCLQTLSNKKYALHINA
jgi:hypothetical protein